MIYLIKLVKLTFQSQPTFKASLDSKPANILCSTMYKSIIQRDAVTMREDRTECKANTGGCQSRRHTKKQTRGAVKTGAITSI